MYLEICEMVEPKVMESDDGWALIKRSLMTFLTNDLEKNNGIFKGKYRKDKIKTEDLNLISGFPKGRSYLYITSPGNKNGAIWGGEDLFCGRT